MNVSKTLLIGITGGIGMGKSTVSDIIRKSGTEVIDTDAIARQVVEPGEPALGEIRNRFGAEVIGPDGRLRRDVLARQVFTDTDARKALEAILHPKIRDRWQARANQWQASGVPMGAVAIPLLYETDSAQEFDAVICVACSAGSQLQRLLDRGWSAEQIRLRNEAQWPVAKKIALANYVIWTEGSLDMTARQVDLVLKDIRERSR